jgi:hypothetical protein
VVSEVIGDNQHTKERSTRFQREEKNTYGVEKQSVTLASPMALQALLGRAFTQH